MKSSLLWALALVSFASAARADESSLSLYGVIDAGLIHQRVTGPQGVRTSHTGMVSGGLSDTLFGVRGHEDLGGGLAAKFQFESMFSLNRGDTSDADHFFNNAAWVGLSSENLGEIRLGRQHTAAQQFASQLEAASWINIRLLKYRTREHGSPSQFAAFDHRACTSWNFSSSRVTFACFEAVFAVFPAPHAPCRRTCPKVRMRVRL